MKLQITSVNVLYEKDLPSIIQIYFSSVSEQRETNIGGYVTLSGDEYVGNETLPVLESKVKQKIIEKLEET